MSLVLHPCPPFSAMFKKLNLLCSRKKSKIESLPRKRESITTWNYWIPALAGMTNKERIGLFANTSKL